jgi:hypothetical protein
MTTLDLARRPDQAAPPPSHRWLMLAVLLGGQFMALLDAFVVNVALPSIGAGLHASGASLQLVVGGYAQVIGVAGFGAAYLSLAQRAGAHAVVSGNALAGTATLLALLALAGLLPAVALARTVLRARP